MKTLKQLKQDRRDFYSQIWLDYTALRKSLHKRIATEKSRLVTEQAKLESQFIARAIKAAGTKELADKMILNDIHFDISSWSHTSNDGKSGLHDFHAIAMLRNGWKPEDHPTFDMGVKRGDYKEHYLLVPERALGEDCPTPDMSKFTKLEDALEATSDFKLTLQGKSGDIDMSFLDETSNKYSHGRTAGEMRDYYLNVYPDKDPNDMMTIFEAMEIMEGMTSMPADRSSMTSEEMALHHFRQSGAVPDGYEVQNTSQGQQLVKL